MKKLIFLLPVLLLLSCSKDTVYSETIDDFENNRWQKGDIKVFKFDINKDMESASVRLRFSHTFDPQYKTVPLDVSVNKPDGKRDNMHVNFQLVDKDGNGHSECDGDICEVKTSIMNDMPLAHGTYTVTVENKFYGAYLPNIEALSLDVENN